MRDCVLSEHEAMVQLSDGGVVVRSGRRQVESEAHLVLLDYRFCLDLCVRWEGQRMSYC